MEVLEFSPDPTKEDTVVFEFIKKDYYLELSRLEFAIQLDSVILEFYKRHDYSSSTRIDTSGIGLVKSFEFRDNWQSNKYVEQDYYYNLYAFKLPWSWSLEGASIFGCSNEFQQSIIIDIDPVKKQILNIYLKYSNMDYNVNNSDWNIETCFVIFSGPLHYNYEIVDNKITMRLNHEILEYFSRIRYYRSETKYINSHYDKDRTDLINYSFIKNTSFFKLVLYLRDEE